MAPPAKSEVSTETTPSPVDLFRVQGETSLSNVSGESGELDANPEIPAARISEADDNELAAGDTETEEDKEVRLELAERAQRPII